MKRDTWVVIPVHNRKNTTLVCLRRLRELGCFDWTHVVVIDDGSTDGTGAAVESEFGTDPVRVVAGDGHLWWAGGINVGMQLACDEGADYVVWLNDDCLPEGDALRQLRDYAEVETSVAVGQAVCPSGNYYGGYRRTLFGIHKMPRQSTSRAIPCDTFSGNAVCIPRAVIDKVGSLDTMNMPMTYGDADFGLRIRLAGFRAAVIGSARFTNEDNLGRDYQSWLLGDYAAREMWRSFYTEKSPLFFRGRFRFYVRHWGPWGYVLAGQAYVRFGLMTLIRSVVPLRLLRALYGRRSKAWRVFAWQERE